MIYQHDKDYNVLLLSEIFPHNLFLLPEVDVWVQVAQPRLRIFWENHFSRPLMNPFKIHVVMANDFLREKYAYPIDYYCGGGEKWTNYHDKNKGR